MESKDNEFEFPDEFVDELESLEEQLGDEEEEGEEDPETESEEKKKKKRKGSKRPLNCFMIFSNAYRPQMKERFPQLSNSELSKLLGNIWKGMSKEDKIPFMKEAEMYKKRFDAEKKMLEVHNEKLPQSGSELMQPQARVLADATRNLLLPPFPRQASRSSASTSSSRRGRRRSGSNTRNSSRRKKGELRNSTNGLQSMAQHFAPKLNSQLQIDPRELGRNLDFSTNKRGGRGRGSGEEFTMWIDTSEEALKNRKSTAELLGLRELTPLPLADHVRQLQESDLSKQFVSISKDLLDKCAGSGLFRNPPK